MITNNDYWTTSVFRIMSKKRSVEDICSKIDIKTTSFHSKGELCSKRNPNSQIRDVNSCIYESPVGENESLNTHIEYILSFLKRNSKGLSELQPDCEFDIMCAYSSESGQGGFMLDHKILKELTKYPVDLLVNLYYYDEKDDE